MPDLLYFIFLFFAFYEQFMDIVSSKIKMQNQVKFQQLALLLGGYLMMKVAEMVMSWRRQYCAKVDRVEQMIVETGIMKWKDNSSQYSDSEALSSMKACGNFCIKDIENIYEIYTNSFPSVTISTLSQNLMQLHQTVCRDQSYSHTSSNCSVLFKY